MQTVFVVLVPSATDQDARDVWCEVIGAAAIDWGLQVAVVDDDLWGWQAPSDWSDRSDVPSRE
jgi:hypothetical protein